MVSIVSNAQFVFNMYYWMEKKSHQKVSYFTSQKYDRNVLTILTFFFNIIAYQYWKPIYDFSMEAIKSIRRHFKNWY